eukprot:gnl/Ergobibamus_cyprinoides/907.p2 GENE.gnl/Ergobibamus_cyprinoides/907~~gnl/Ergobibamus_cyprinoides/907.p2  ORF type:complete len:145 (-),score=13.85 gnl/Ergobibamus_cyprinoides/907:119-553(-)
MGNRRKRRRFRLQELQSDISRNPQQYSAEQQLWVRQMSSVVERFWNPLNRCDSAGSSLAPTPVARSASSPGMIGTPTSVAHLSRANVTLSPQACFPLPPMAMPNSYQPPPPPGVVQPAQPQSTPAPRPTSADRFSPGSDSDVSF